MLYAPSSPLLRFYGEDPPISDSKRDGDVVMINLPGGVRQVSVGRRHVVAMTTTGEGN